MTEKFSYEQLHELWWEHWQRYEELENIRHKLENAEAKKDPEDRYSEQYYKHDEQLHNQGMRHWQEAQFLRTNKLAVEVFGNWENDGGIVSRLESLQSYPSFATASEWYPQFISAAKDYFQSGEVPAAVKRIEDIFGTAGLIPIYGDYLLATKTVAGVKRGPAGANLPYSDLKLDACSQPQFYRREDGKKIPLEYFAARVQTHLMNFVAEHQLPQRLISRREMKKIKKLAGILEIGGGFLSSLSAEKAQRKYGKAQRKYEKLMSPINGRIERALVSYNNDIPVDTYMTLVKALHFSYPIHTFGGETFFRLEPGQEGFVFFFPGYDRLRSEETIRGEHWWNIGGR